MLVKFMLNLKSQNSIFLHLNFQYTVWTICLLNINSFFRFDAFIEIYFRELHIKSLIHVNEYPICFIRIDYILEYNIIPVYTDIINATPVQFFTLGN